MSLTDASPEQVAQAAATSAQGLSILSEQDRNDALTAIHNELLKHKDQILKANAIDVAAATKAAAEGQLSDSLLKRLDLTVKYDDMLQGILDVRNLEDPVGKITLKTVLDDDLVLERVTCPIGVLLIIFEARPEVIANITALAIKSGNAAILKGGKESTESFKAISTIVQQAIGATKVPAASIQLLTTRDIIPSLLKLGQYINLCIPRGGNDLVRYVKSNTQIPVLGHADGLCAIYVHEDADPKMAVKILLDAKLGYPAACNAVETLLIDSIALGTSGIAIATALLERGVQLRCDEQSKDYFSKYAPFKSSPKLMSLIIPSTEADYKTEFLSPTLAILTISPTLSSPSARLSFAISHINTHGSHHTDAILTSNPTFAKQFQAGVDSACVFWNTSTRVADGMRFGFGTEVGISTNKIHSRGPVGLEGLTIYKYVVSGRGQIAGEYGVGKKAFKHEVVKDAFEGLERF
ncbi:MAG: hypothetical protein MMC33_002704 [Icmadophila ericetorum]|nr:hypothetical protein [Icmadophila ericetorum]